MKTLIQEIFDTLQDELSHNLSGVLLFNDADSIRWQLDGIQYGHSESDLEDLANDDMDLIREVLDDYAYENDVEITEPEFDDTYVFFYIEEL